MGVFLIIIGQCKPYIRGFIFVPLKIKIMENYKAPEQTKIGHVHLKVSNLDKALSFYRDLLGLEVTQYFGEDAVFLSAGGLS